MTVRLIGVAFLLLGSLHAGAQTEHGEGQAPLKFMGRDVTIVDTGMEDDFFPKGPASVCVEGPAQKQCLTVPEAFGKNPTATLVQLKKDMPAIFFSVATGGVSGWMMRFFLLRPGDGKDLDDLFMADVSVSNQSEHAVRTDPTISEAKDLRHSGFLLE